MKWIQNLKIAQIAIKLLVESEAGDFLLESHLLPSLGGHLVELLILQARIDVAQLARGKAAGMHKYRKI